MWNQISYHWTQEILEQKKKKILNFVIFSCDKAAEKSNIGDVFG